MTEAASKPLPWNLATVVTVNVLLFGLLAWAWVTFGSLGAALSYANGDRLIAKPAAASLGTVALGEEHPLVFPLQNYSGRDIAIVGASTSCSCIATDGLPMTIPARSRRDLVVRVQAPKQAGKVHEHIYLYTNYEHQSGVVLKIEGNALEQRR